MDTARLTATWGPRRTGSAVPGSPQASAGSPVTIATSVHADPPGVPLGALSLCAALRARGYATDLRDLQELEGGDRVDPAGFARWLAESGDQLGIGTLSATLPLVLLATRALKASRPGRTIILGGPGASGNEASILEAFPSVDVVVRGEGEETLVELIDAIRGGRPLSGVRGITYRSGPGVRTNPDRPRIADLDLLPSPYRGAVRLDGYLDPRWSRFAIFGILTSRGCPYSCAFCAIPTVWRGGARRRSLSPILEEIRILRDEYGLDRFRILDDTFTLDRRAVLDFCDALARTGWDMRWVCHGRVDHMDEEVVASLHAAGCAGILFGIESGSDRILQRVGKGFTLARALDVIQMCSARLVVEASFIWGYPFETLDDFYDTLIALLAVHAMGCRTKLTLLMPDPASSLTREWLDDLEPTLRDDVLLVSGKTHAFYCGPEVRAIVEAHPRLFSAFFHLRTPEFETKCAYIRQHATETDADAGVSMRPGVGAPLVDVAGTDGGSSVAGQARTPEGDDWLPAARAGVLHRTVGGRRFLFDVESFRLFRATPGYERVLQACRDHRRHADLVAELAARSGRPTAEVEGLVETMLEGLRRNGLVTTSR